MRLSELVGVSGNVQRAAGRGEKIQAIASLLRRVAPFEVETAVAFLSGSLRQGRIGIGGAALNAARPPAASRPTLELTEVDGLFDRIAGTAGPGSSQAKGELLHELLSRATAEEQDFLRRLLFGELRQGAQEGVMMEAIARAADLPLASLRRAAMAEGDLGPVAAVALSEGERGLVRSAVRLFRPVRPMLATPADNAADALERLGQAALEYKLDGARVQVHKDGETVRVFSRSHLEVTPAVPEIVQAARGLPALRLILDGEAIALRPDGTPHPFQVSMRRFGRKTGVERARETLPLSLFLFDILFLEGDVLIDRPYSERTRILEEQAPADLIIPRTLARSSGEAEAFLYQSLSAGHEGIMAKDPASPYEAGSRGFGWLKIKRVETLDLVVLAAEWGNGRRQGRLSNLHLGARDTSSGSFVMLGKTFKGMTDPMLAWQTEKLLALEIGRDAYTVHVRPELVVEIAFAEVQQSPRYPGGLALRFARVKRYRPEKPAREADTIERVREIFRRTGATA